MIWIGIDPGLDGGVASIVETLAMTAVSTVRTPVLSISKRGKNRREYSLPEMLRTLRSMGTAPLLPFNPSLCRAAVENVHAFPREGAVASFSFGGGFYAWLMALTALGIPYTRVEPVRWKKTMMDGMGKEKEASLLRASQLFPSARIDGTKASRIGQADALLLAEYLRRTEGGRHPPITIKRRG